MTRSTADTLIGSRLMILQSKRLMLNSASRRLETSHLDSMRERVDHLRAETEQAQHAYRRTMLDFGSPERAEYWLVAYGRLIDAGSALVRKLRRAAHDLPVEERYQVSTDVEALEGIIEQWSDSMRSSMGQGA
jgi:hypothetical protein